MPAPKIPRSPIPKFSRAQLDKANLCATALWYGINFETGKNHISDAGLMADFAGHFYHFHRKKKRYQPDIFVKDVRDLILGCGIKVLFCGSSEMDFAKGIDSLYIDVYPEFLYAQKKPSNASSLQASIKSVELLSKGLVKDPANNRLHLASRIVFFLCPNLQTFNMNNKIATFFGLQTRAHHHYAEYFELFSKGMRTNQSRLSKYQMPPARDGLDMYTWNQAQRTDWWHRRVLEKQ